MTQDYIQGLRQQLKDFSREEQEAFIEEIRSHIESGEDDPRMGKDLEQRRSKLMAELGSSKEMGRNFKAIYRQNKWIDFLWVAIPYFLYPYLNMLYVSLLPKYSWADVRLDILIHLPLIAIGLWRRSAAVALFWIATLSTQIAGMLMITGGFYGTVQTVFWFILMLGLIALLGYIAWQNRQDVLIVFFALLPWIMCTVGSFFVIIHPGAVAIYGPVDKFLLKIYIDIAGFGGGYLPYYGTLTAMALFFLTTNRDIRWLALGLYGLVIGLSRHYINVFDGETGLMVQWVYVVFALLPLVTTFLGWWLDQSGRRQLKFAE